MLFSQIVYGPIHSRRLGVSLGINLMPTEQKICSFNCIYCECGFNQPAHEPRLPSRWQVQEALRTALEGLQSKTALNVITFSGNGEPTLHPDFKGIIEDTCALRDQYAPQAKIAVLSNSTQLHRADVREALLLVDDRILKLDSALTATMRLIDQPLNPTLQVEDICQLLAQFHSDFILQTCFLKGTYNGHAIDNTTDEEVQAWLKCCEALRPRQVMLYCIDRPTPAHDLQKIAPARLDEIAQQVQALGIDTTVAY